MGKFVYFIAIVISLTPILTHISEKNYIIAILYTIFFICVLQPFIKRLIYREKL